MGRSDKTEKMRQSDMGRSFLVAASPNRAYLASVLCTFAQILLRGTSDTLVTLYEIGKQGRI